MMSKKLNEEEKHEKGIFDETNKKIEEILSKLENNEAAEVYKDIKLLVRNYFKKLFLTAHEMTEKDVENKLKNFQIDIGGIEKAKKILEFISSVEYNRQNFEKEDLFLFIDEFKDVVEELYRQTKAITLSKKEKVTKKKQEYILNKFDSNLKALVKYYKAKGKLPEEKLVKITEYYNLLSSENKDKFSKDYHYYCINLPHLLFLIKKAKTIDQNNEDEFHPLISKINRIFLKLGDDEKKELSEKILKAIDSDEEKLNIYIMVGYHYMHLKKFDDIHKTYKKMLNHYESLDKVKKKYYHYVIKRFLQHLKSEKIKRDKKLSLRPFY